MNQTGKDYQIIRFTLYFYLPFLISKANHMQIAPCSNHRSSRLFIINKHQCFDSKTDRDH